MAGGTDWYLEDFRDDADVRTANKKVYEQPHLIVAISKQIQATKSIFGMTDRGTKSGKVGFMVGPYYHAKFCAAGKAFLCTADGCVPAEKPLGYVVRRQVWEYWGDETEITFAP